MRLRLFFGLSLTLPLGAINDGPYVFYQQNLPIVYYLNQGKVITEKLPPGRKEFKGFYFDKNRHYNLQLSKPYRARFTKVGKWFAISDIHGQFHLLKKLLREAGVIDKNHNWAFGRGHLVIAGDVFDRGPFVTESLWLIYKLTVQARQSRGYVHYLLGNHETMMLKGHKRYLNKKYRKAYELLAMPLKEVYGPNSFFGRRLREQNSLLQLNQTMFLHGGISPELVSRKLSLGSINHLVFAKEYTNKEIRDLLWGSKGVFWYRGYFRKSRRYPKITKQELLQVLNHFKAKRLIVGHTSQQQITSYFNGQVIAIDASMKRGKRGEGLLYKDGLLYRVATDQAKQKFN